MPKDPHVTGGIRHDWAAIKHEYVTNPDTSLRKLAEKYGVSYRTIANKSKAEGWFATRKESISKVISKGISITETKMANNLAKELAAVDCISDKITEMLEDSRQFNKHFVEIGEGKGVYHTELWEYDKVDVKQMKDTLASLKMIEDIKRSLIGIQRIEQIEKKELERERFEFDKEIQRERLELEKERIALERERNALRNGNRDNDDSTYGVVLLPEVLPEVMPDE